MLTRVSETVDNKENHSKTLRKARRNSSQDGMEAVQKKQKKTNGA